MAELSTGEPSPKSQAYETMVPSLSVEPADENSTPRGALPASGVALATATGAWFSLTWTETVVVSVSPESSVTVSVAA